MLLRVRQPRDGQGTDAGPRPGEGRAAAVDGTSISVRRGLDISLPGAPVQAIGDGSPVRSIALLGADFPDVRPLLRVEVGEEVAAGQTLFIDRRRPEIAFTAPMAGTVAGIHRGPRRSLDALVVGAIRTVADAPGHAPHIRRRADLKGLLLGAGLWPAFRARPFGRIPDPGTEPDAIFVTAMDTNPLAADAAFVISHHAELFRRAVDALTLLTDGPLFVCQAPGPALAGEADARVACVRFAGPHPSGLPGTHIDRLAPVRDGRRVWHIGYQDVIAIGHLLATGSPWAERVIALAGPGARAPRLVCAPLGASLDDLLAGELGEGDHSIVAGSPLGGRTSAYLGRYHTQVSVLPARAQSSPVPMLRRLLAMRGKAAPPLVPRAALEQAMVFDIPPVPLLRALSVGDVETAEMLGCIGLVEEDLALLSYACASGADYGAMLRAVLGELEGGGPQGGSGQRR